MSAALRVVFAGTPEFAVPCLDVCAATVGVQLLAVYTQPDRPAGRGKQLSASPVKQRALALDLPVLQPLSLKDPDAQRALAELAPDLLVVVAYGLILPRAVLAIPSRGCWNVHGSALPRWRGAAPIQRAIEAGDAQTGVDLMVMEAGLDTGPVLLSRRTAIALDDTGGSLHDRLMVHGAEVLAEGLQRLLDGTLPAAVTQSEDGVSYAHKLDKAEATLDWSLSAELLQRKVRAYWPWPVAQGDLAGDRVQILAASAISTAALGAPGSIQHTGRDGIDVACGSGVLRITRLKRPGGRELSAWDYLNGRPALKIVRT
jgi:methionyl-tRNA formyltransferase